jgi:hypothetical protein
MPFLIQQTEQTIDKYRVTLPAINEAFPPVSKTVFSAAYHHSKELRRPATESLAIHHAHKASIKNARGESDEKPKSREERK